MVGLVQEKTHSQLAVPRRDKSPGEAVVTVCSPGFFVFWERLDLGLGRVFL